MNETEGQSGSAKVAGHGEEAHEDHGQDEAAEPLGPLDMKGWAFAFGGGAVGLLVALALFAATGA